MSPGRHTLISLFAGAGGLDLGLEQAGFSTVVASDLAPHACETLRQNKVLGSISMREFDGWFETQLAQRCYQRLESKAKQRLRQRIEAGAGRHRYLRHARVIEGDVRRIASRDLAGAARVNRGEVMLIAGGPPCQPFSRAGKRDTVDSSDGQLFMDFVRIVADVRPRFFLFENVKGLSQSKTTLWFVKCSLCRREWFPPFENSRQEPDDRAPGCACGSARTKWVVQRGIPGGSLELILAEFERIGYTLTWRLLNAADFGAAQTRERLFIVGSRENERFEWPLPTHMRAPDGAVQMRMLEPAASPVRRWTAIEEVLWLDGHPEFGELDHCAELWVKNVVRPHDEPVTWTLSRPCPTVGAHQAAKFALAPEGVPYEQLRRQQWHVLGRRQGDVPAVPVKHSYLSDEELLILQTFPSWWYLFGTRMERAFQIGNAVPPLFGRLIGNAILTAAGEQRVAETA